MTRYSGCGICMKVCPIQKYGMKPVMEHYIETGEVLGKGTENLEGYTLPDKGHFRPGKLPSFNAEFFDMPRGKVEDLLFDEFKQKLENAQNDSAETSDDVWKEFRERIDEALIHQSGPLDMGMDLSN